MNLFIVATPIGNLGDISFRAIETLKSVDAIFCEDTRETRKLTGHYQIEKKLVSLHQHSTPERISRLLGEYENIAYVTDAGTPGISDPGNKIVEIALDLGFEIIPIPGASAVISALSISGFPTDKFLFLGFMPHKGKGRTMERIRDSEITSCFYESPHRIMKTLAELKTFVGDERRIVVCRELTKMFETIYRGRITDVEIQVAEMVKGEYVVIVDATK